MTILETIQKGSSEVTNIKLSSRNFSTILWTFSC